ncbi:MAG: hypothetical protein LC676_10985 [Loktanella sp.]|nr:hypothetical protein [Loktanella sp.]
MAEQLKPGDAAPEAITDDEYRGAITSINYTKREAAEHQGEAAKLTKDFCDRHNIDKAAFTKVCQLAKMEDRHKALAFIRGFIDGSRRMGFFDQVDAFSDADLISVLRGIVEEAEAGKDMTRQPDPDGVAGRIGPAAAE